MGNRPTKTPAIPDARDELSKAIKEVIEVREGRRGDPLDRFVTLRELRDGGIVTTVVGGRGTGNNIGIGGPGTIPGLPNIGEGPPDYGDDDPSRPPTPTGVRAAGIGENQIMVTFDPPIYSNHWFAEVFRIPKEYQRRTTPTLSEITPASFNPVRPVGPSNLNEFYVGMTYGSTFIDELPRTNLYNPLDPAGTFGQPNVDDALNPTPFWYWVRFVSRAQIAGPFHENAARANRMINPTEVLDGLIGEVQTTAAFARLRNWLGIGPGNLFNDVLNRGGLAAYTQSEIQTITGKFETLTVTVDTDRSRVAESTYWQAGLAGYVGSTSVLHLNIVSYSATFAVVTLAVSVKANANLLPQLIIGSKIRFYPRSTSLSFLAGKEVTISGISGTGNNRTFTFTRAPWMPESSVIPGGTSDTATFVAGSADSGSGLVNTIAAVAQDIMVDVRPTSAIANLVNTVGLQLGQRIQIANSVISTVRADMTRLTNEYTIGLRQDVDGIISATGVSLSLEGAIGSNQPARSAMIISADQFAIMGSGSGASRVKAWTKITSTRATATVENAAALNSIWVATAARDGTALLDTPMYITFTQPAEYMALADAPPVSTPPTIPAIPGTPPAAINPAIPPTPAELTQPATDAAARNAARGALTTALQLVQNNLGELNKFRKLTLRVESINVAAKTITLKTDIRTGTPLLPESIAETDAGFWREANVVLMPEQSMPFIVDTVRNVVAIRGTLVVDGLITTQDLEVSRLLRAREIWTRSIIGDNANFQTIVGQRIVAGNYPNPTGNVPANTGQYIIALQNPGVLGSSGKPIRFYRPEFNGQGAEVHNGNGRDAFFVDGAGSVFIGGNLTVRTDAGGPNACSLIVGAKRLDQGINSSDERYALWVGPKTAIINGDFNDSTAVFWVKEATSGGRAQAGFNADLFLDGTPFKQPMLATGLSQIQITPGNSNFTYLGNSTGSAKSHNSGLRAVSATTDVKSDGVIEIRARTDGSIPPVLVIASVNLARYNVAGNKDDKRFLLTMILQRSDGHDTIVHSQELDDYTPDTYTGTLMGVCLPPSAGVYKVRVSLLNLNTNNNSAIAVGSPGFMSILAGWTSFAQYVTEVGDNALKLGAPLDPSQIPAGWSPTQRVTVTGGGPNSPEPPPGGGGPLDPTEPVIVP